MANEPQHTLESAKLIVVMGKGGVGKSVVAAALGRLAASAGREVLLVEVDPRENLHQLLDVPPSDGEIVQAGPSLRLQHMHPRQVLDDLVAERLKFGPLARRVLASPVHQHFAEGAPGLKESAVLGRILRMLDGHTPKEVTAPDLVILDSPASGHGVPFLAAPGLISSVIDSGPIGQMAEDIDEMISDPERTSFVVVSLAEEMPVQETVELIDTMSTTLERSPSMVIVNGIYPLGTSDELPTEVDPAAAAADALWRARAEINSEQLERLRHTWLGPLFQVPLFAVDRGPVLIELISQTIESDLRV